MQETVLDFKARIALLVRQRETGKQYSVNGAAREDECVVRQPGDRGYYAPNRRKPKR